VTAAPQPTTATISGLFEVVGGPAGASPGPVSGVVTLRGGGHSYIVSVGPTGRFSVNVAAGVYTATGQSPSFDAGRGACVGADPVVAVVGQTSPIEVICQRR
jgi:hypothetical protein